VVGLHTSDMTDEAKKEVEHINLKVLGQDGQMVHFKIKQHTSLKKLMSAYCARSKMVQSTVRFRFDGQPISESDTPRDLDMEDGDTIEVFQQQTGGCGEVEGCGRRPVTFPTTLFSCSVSSSSAVGSYFCGPVLDIYRLFS